MRHTLILVSTLLSTVALTGPLRADAISDGMVSYVHDKVMPWLSSPEVQQALLSQNAAHAGLTEPQIIDLDKAWRAEIGAGSTPTITPVLTSPTSEFLRTKMAESGGVITEMILMDDKGLNTAITGTTSDYWQGDEDKFLKTFPVGPDAVDVSGIELDESSQQYQAQVSIVVPDASTGAPIGVLTVGLNAENF